MAFSMTILVCILHITRISGLTDVSCRPRPELIRTSHGKYEVVPRCTGTNRCIYCSITWKKKGFSRKTHELD